MGLIAAPLPDRYEAGFWVGIILGFMVGTLFGIVWEKAHNAWREHIVLRGKIRRSRWAILYTNRTAAGWVLTLTALAAAVIYSKIN